MGNGGSIVAGVELGGTKAIATIGRGREILAQTRIATTTPDETFAAIGGWLDAQRALAPRALGIASFGPVAVAHDDPSYGRILATPKPGWSGADVIGALARHIDGPRVIESDVTAAARAEGRWGAAQGIEDFVYVTIGTGIGMGIIAGGRAIVGALHPEAGHIRVRRLAGDAFAGICPFHGDCLEGLASGPAITARAGVPADRLAPGDPHWAPIADALAQGFATLFMTLATRRIVVGGGVGANAPHLIAAIRTRVVESVAGYLPFIAADTIDRRIVVAALGGDAGPLGTLLIAQAALTDR